MTSNAPNRYFFLTSVATLALLTGSCSSSIFEADSGKTSDIAATMRSPRALISMGDTTWRGGDVASAARFYQQAVKEAPRDPVPAFRLARALQAMGAHKQAAEHFRKVLKLRPGDGDAKRQLANTLISMDEPKASIKLFQEVIAEHGDYRAFNGLGVALDMTGKHKDALTAYRAGLAKQPKSLTLKNNLALSMALAGQYANAAKVLQSVTAHPRATARHRQNLALVYGLAGQDKQAAQVASLDLDGPSVERNLDYYNWLRRQPRWMVKKMLRNGAPAKPQAASAKPRAEAAAPRKAKPSAARKPAIRKPVSAAPRKAERPAPRRQDAAAPSRVDRDGIIRHASLTDINAAPVRFARLEFGFRPVRDADKPETAGKREATTVVTAAPMPAVVRGSGTPARTAAAKPAAMPATPEAAGGATVVKPTAAAPRTPAPEVKVVPTQLAMAGTPAPRTPEKSAALRRIEARFMRAGLESLMADPEKSQ